MLSHRSQSLDAIRKLGTIVLTLSVYSLLHAQSATSPTSSEDPGSLDQIWQKASRKYDTARAALLNEVDRVDNEGPFRPDWESLQQYETPNWYKEAKFGIFIHWGVYSVPAFADEWYPRNMYREGSDEYKHHLATYGSPEKFGYKNFIPMFKAEHFDPAAWAQLFKKAGAKYVVPVAEHHDGFAIYDSGLSDWTAAGMERTATLSATELSPCGPKVCILVCHRIGLSTISFWAWVVVSPLTLTIRNALRFTARLIVG